MTSKSVRVAVAAITISGAVLGVVLTRAIGITDPVLTAFAMVGITAVAAVVVTLAWIAVDVRRDERGHRRNP